MIDADDPAHEARLEEKAREIADGATAGYEKIVPPHVLAEMKRLLIADMICTDEGRAQLESCLEPVPVPN